MSSKKASPGSAAKKKQVNMFSFFAKKKPVPKPHTPSKSSIAADEAAKSLPASAKSAPGSKHAKPAAPGRKDGNAALLAKITIGTRVAVYWPDDKEYYPGVLRGRRKDPDSSFYTILYDDETVETCDMSKEKFKIIGGKKRRSNDKPADDSDDEDDVDVGDSPASNGRSGKKKRRIQEDSESEFDEAMLGESDDEDDGGNDSDGSNFMGGDESESEDEDDDDALMVTDEDDDEVVAKSNKKSSKKRTTRSRALTNVKVTTLEPTAEETAAAAAARECSDDSNHANEELSPVRPKSANRGGASPPDPFACFALNKAAKQASAAAKKTANPYARKKAEEPAPPAAARHERVSPVPRRDAGKREEKLTPPRPGSSSHPAGSKAAELDSKKITPSPMPPPGVGTAAATKPREFRKPPLPKDGEVNPKGTHWHNHYKFVFDARDSKGRVPDHPDYDSKTLQVDKKEIMRVVGRKNIPPAQEQWWDLKAMYADSIMLFKTGKFYEIFHMDADVAVSALGLIYMKGAPAHCGFPEAAIGTFSRRLVEAGYKVARIEQTETKAAFDERKKMTPKGKKKPQVQSREVCSISTMGTRTFCFLDDVRCFESEGGVPAGVGPLIAIRETLTDVHQQCDDEDSVPPVCEYGVAIVNAVTGVVTVGQFADDMLRSRMDTLLTKYAPSEILYEGGPDGASPTLLSLLKSAASQATVRLEKVNPVESFPKSTANDLSVRRQLERPSSDVKPWDVQEALEELHRRAYYPRSTRGAAPNANAREGVRRWPDVLRSCVEGGADLALSAFGAALFTLQRNLIDREILSMGIVKAYVPAWSPSASEEGGSPSRDGTDTAAKGLRQLSARADRKESGIETDGSATENDNAEGATSPDLTPRDLFSSMDTDNAAAVSAESSIDHMSLDGTTIANLEILANAHSNTADGSLWSKLDQTKTPHGSRLLRAWLLRPLFRKVDIDRRADAVQQLASGGAAVAMSEARTLLGQCGDIERLLARVHSMGQGVEPADGTSDAAGSGAHHPNERAVLYETATHTKRKVGDFSRLLKGLRAASQIPDLFAGCDVGPQSGFLSKIVRTTEEGGSFPADLPERLDWFFEMVDLKAAEKGQFEPVRGMDDAYDECCDAIERIEGELRDYREEVLTQLRIPGHLKKKCVFVNVKPESKDRYLLELPQDTPVPNDWSVEAQRKKPVPIYKYRTPITAGLVESLEAALDAKKEGKARGLQMVFHRFDEMRSLWDAAQLATAMLDALGTLAETAARPGYTRPIIADCGPTDGPSVRVMQGRHPCVDVTHSGGEYIPNDLVLGGNDAGDNSRILLLSGPNMGGKSTLLRQTCLITILAQIGCYVPAEECVITPVDRIFTRLGASDRILLGQSTFFVELAETAAALRGATRRSLVIMDELGRGTSTFDGTAIASATVKHLVESNRCITLFATHYHSLLEDWREEPAVRLGHMECLVEGGEEGDEDADDDKEHNITFLYTLGEGGCPKSFGINVARLAALPEEILSKAKERSAAFEREVNGTAPLATTTKVTQSNAESLTDALMAAIDSGDVDAERAIWSKIQ